MHVTHHPHDVQQAQVPIHVSELDGFADRVVIGPARFRELRTDHGDVRRDCVVAFLEQAASQQRDTHRLEVARTGDAEFGRTRARLILHDALEVLHVEALVHVIQDQERSVAGGTGV